MVIYFADHAVISLSRQAKFAVAVVIFIALFIGFWREGWQSHPIGVVQVQKTLWRNPGRMRGVNSRDAQKRAAFTCAFRHILNGSARYPRRVCVFIFSAKGDGVFGKSLLGVIHAVFYAHHLMPALCQWRQSQAQMIELIRCFQAYPGAICIFVTAGFVTDFQMVKSIIGMYFAVVSIGVWQKVQFADVCGVISGIVQQFWKCHKVFGHGYTHMCNAECGGILSGQKTHPAGHAHGVLDKVVVEVYTLVCEAIQIRRLDIGVPIYPHGIPPLLVGVNQ